MGQFKIACISLKHFFLEAFYDVSYSYDMESYTSIAGNTGNTQVIHRQLSTTCLMILNLSFVSEPAWLVLPVYDLCVACVACDWRVCCLCMTCVLPVYDLCVACVACVWLVCCLCMTYMLPVLPATDLCVACVACECLVCCLVGLRLICVLPVYDLCFAYAWRVCCLRMTCVLPVYDLCVTCVAYAWRMCRLCMTCVLPVYDLCVACVACVWLVVYYWTFISSSCHTNARKTRAQMNARMTRSNSKNKIDKCPDDLQDPAKSRDSPRDLECHSEYSGKEPIIAKTFGCQDFFQIKKVSLGVGHDIEWEKERERETERARERQRDREREGEKEGDSHVNSCTHAHARI